MGTINSGAAPALTDEEEKQVSIMFGMKATINQIQQQHGF